MSLIRVDKDTRGVATVTLTRAEKHNALSAEMMTELEQAARDLAADHAVRVVVLAAEGKSFCAGGDLGWMRAQFDMDAATRRIESRRIATVLQALYDLPQPLIGRIHGNALGGGVGLVSVCDVAIGVSRAKLGFTETRLGLIPANIGPYVLARMGATRASEVFMSARVFEAEEAVRLNLLSRTVAPDALDAAIAAEVQPYLSCAPGAVADAKSLMRDLTGRVTPQQVDTAIDALAARWQTAEAQEGVGAFFDKRAPKWQ
ncbi:crotonase/enoyl-CoA hydratase family protein [Marivita sp. XM-24bin2]|uniref:crotonase/enoyl-CoA hydratase family protein n=1 Tax=unclassified Marivita TaxID=2632480 RepID=UPI000D79206E|nr:crotonase/enoyl-CoA hydratase family protein [Marivita sp. XM-24bin2]MCR9107593.1 crotonase/enoyl-CoA hydratase family protein [Paracoccaceae bacterium]PWL34858.1 MAG: crotonase/enoyl-CoA hydratase family protein [Marivita sp. XM-24bin2]